MYAENCDKSVLKRLLKQLWKIVMKSLERNIVLPPINEKVNIVLTPTKEKIIYSAASYKRKGKYSAATYQ